MNTREEIKVKLAEVADAATSMILAMEGLDDKSCEEKIIGLSEQYTAEGLSHSDALERATLEVLTQREKRLNVGAKMSEVDLDDPDVLAKVTARASELEKAGMSPAEALEKAGVEVLGPLEEKSRGWRK